MTDTTDPTIKEVEAMTDAYYAHCEEAGVEKTDINADLFEVWLSAWNAGRAYAAAN